MTILYTNRIVDIFSWRVNNNDNNNDDIAITRIGSS